MKTPKKRSRRAPAKDARWRDVPGIVITDGGAGHRLQLEGPRLRAFIYGEEQPSSPTLPFGRWKG